MATDTDHKATNTNTMEVEFTEFTDNAPRYPEDLVVGETKETERNGDTDDQDDTDNPDEHEDAEQEDQEESEQLPSPSFHPDDGGVKKDQKQEQAKQPHHETYTARVQRLLPSLICVQRLPSLETARELKRMQTTYARLCSQVCGTAGPEVESEQKPLPSKKICVKLQWVEIQNHSAFLAYLETHNWIGLVSGNKEFIQHFDDLKDSGQYLPYVDTDQALENNRKRTRGLIVMYVILWLVTLLTIRYVVAQGECVCDGKVIQDNNVVSRLSGQDL